MKIDFIVKKTKKKLPRRSVAINSEGEIYIIRFSQHRLPYFIMINDKVEAKLRNKQ